MAMKLVDTDVLDAGLTRVADKVREKAGTSEMLAFPDGYESALDTIESADSALAEVEYLLSDGYKNYSYYFHYKTWMEEVPYQLIRNVSNGEDFSCMFISNSSLKRIPPLNTVNGKDFTYMFDDCRALETIEGIDFSNATSSLYTTFDRCDELKNLTVNGIIKKEIDFFDCKKLTHESLMSIINALFDWVADGQSPYIEICLGSTNLEKLTDDEKNIVTSKGWSLS